MAAVRGVGRGKTSGAGAAKGPAKASGPGFSGRVEKTTGLQGPSGVVGSSQVNQVSLDPVAQQATELIRQLKSGELKSRDEATKKLVAKILKEKVRTQSKHLADRIFNELKDDPMQNEKLEQLWKRADDE